MYAVLAEESLTSSIQTLSQKWMTNLSISMHTDCISNSAILSNSYAC